MGGVGKICYTLLVRNAVVERWNFLTKEQKISVGILGVCGVFAIGMSLLTFERNLTNPFLKSRAAVLAAKSKLAPSEEDRVAEQKRRDTDGDGLSDWDEINLYKTNPNLRDTCGDGIPDNIRVATGKNLTCATKGAGTGASELDLTNVQSSSTALFGVQSVDLSALVDLEASRSAGNSTGILPRDPAAIRAALAGRIEKSKLAKISDETLLELYDEAMAQSRGEAATTTVPSL